MTAIQTESQRYAHERKYPNRPILEPNVDLQKVKDDKDKEKLTVKSLIERMKSKDVDVTEVE